MKFFVPEAEDDEQAEEVWQATKLLVEDQRGPVKDRRINRIEYYDGDLNTVHDVAVGQTVPRVGEPAIVILEAATSSSFDVFYICTPTRAVLEGGPIMIGKNNVRSVEEFES